MMTTPPTLDGLDLSNAQVAFLERVAEDLDPEDLQDPEVVAETMRDRLDRERELIQDSEVMGALADELYPLLAG